MPSKKFFKSTETNKYRMHWVKQLGQLLLGVVIVGGFIAVVVYLH